MLPLMTSAGSCAPGGRCSSTWVNKTNSASVRSAMSSGISSTFRPTPHQLSGVRVQLEKSFRYRDDSPLGAAAQAIEPATSTPGNASAMWVTSAGSRSSSEEQHTTWPNACRQKPRTTGNTWPTPDLRRKMLSVALTGTGSCPLLRNQGPAGSAASPGASDAGLRPGRTPPFGPCWSGTPITEACSAATSACVRLNTHAV